MIAFDPSEDQTLMRDSVAQFARSSLAPRVRDFEKLRGIPEDIRKTAHEMGLGLVALPEACGGQGLGLVTAVLLEEELAAADPAAPFALAGPHAFGLAVVELGTVEQAAAQLAPFGAADAHGLFGAVAWSEPKPNKERAGFSTIAERDGDGWRITGKKAFVHNAQLADRFVVFAQISRERSERRGEAERPSENLNDGGAGWNGIGAFLVERDTAGVKIGARHDTLGLDAASFGEIELANVRVSDASRLTAPHDEGPDGFVRATLRFFVKHALLVAARAVGASRFAFELAREHCDTRKAFGKPIGHFQAVAFTLADRLMDVDSSRWLVWRAARAWDAHAEISREHSKRRGEAEGRAENQAEAGKKKKAEREALLASAQAVAHALEAAMRCGDDCVGLHGGSGFIRDLIAEKLMRDAKQLALSCMTAEQLDQLAAALDLGLPLDPALVLPTPDAQAIFT